ncbi:hypothetical protein ACFL2X_03500, partial [Candidatus Latescibacterota bacterium]
MKFKLTVLTLLVVGMVLGLSGVASGDVVLTLKTQDNTTILVDDSADAIITRIPLLKFSVTNNEAAGISFTGFKTTNGTANLNGNDFELTVIDDANDNGIYDTGDAVLVADVALEDLDTAETTLTFTAPAAIGIGDSLNMIILVDKLATAEPLDTVELLVNTDDLTITGAPTVVQHADTDLATNAEANVPQLAAKDGADGAGTAGTVTTAAHTITLTAGDFPNMKTGQIIAAFKITGDDAALSHMLSAIRIADTGDAADADLDVAKIYIDKTGNGIVGADDIQLVLGATTYVSAVNNYALTTPVLIRDTAALNFLVTVNGLGTASEGETVIAALEAAGTTMDGAVAIDDDLAGVTKTMRALQAAWETVDVTGPPFGRPNGYLDAIKVSFYTGGTQVGAVVTGGTPANVDDSKLVFATPSVEWIVTEESAGGGAHVETFSATYNSDVADNNYFYIKIDEQDISITSDAAELTYAPGAAPVVDAATGTYALVAFADVAAVDAAPPAPLSVKTVDAGNGIIDHIDVYFSEALTAGDHTGFSFTGLTVTAGTIETAVGMGVAPFDAADMRLSLVVTEKGHNTGITPAYTYSSVTGLHTDGINEVLGFNSLALPAIDEAAPTLVKVTVVDNDS